METEKEPIDREVILVTGGAGFIGSHVVDALMKKEAEVRVLDNLSGGSLDNLRKWLNHPLFKFIKGDLLDRADVTKATDGCETVFHLAANPEVRLGSVAPEIHFEQNVLATYNLLESLRKADTVKSLVFTSSSTVYGDASEIPTPEDYSPLEPISVYGASKLASEALINAYAHTYGFRAVIFRLANIIGPRSSHGVTYDFVQKLRENLHELEILGDGTQAKSYLYFDDFVEAMLLSFGKSNSPVEVFNLGSEDWVDVKTIARIVVEEMCLKDVSFRFTGGVDGGRGWKGDVKYMLLAIKKLKSLGWKPKLNSSQAVRATARSILGKTG
ncbi:MAG: NAD-dependent epimerase/dehydratase family protein [Candidatus Bathyarchaeota archaeon]|nr:NAD-dependent epimerase/dehydratase family protein [Candidatus Bathyarchaeota archaeon]